MKNFIQSEFQYFLIHQKSEKKLTTLTGYTNVNAENLGDIREFFGRKVLN